MSTREIPKEIAEGLERVTRETPFSHAQISRAFATLRPKFYTDAQALESVARLALITLRAGEQDIDVAAEVIAELAQDVDRDAPPAVDVAPGNVIALHPEPPASQARRRRALPHERKLPHGTIRVEGGQRTPFVLPPEQQHGVPDPKVGAMVAEGKARYHLDTLGELARESESALRLELQAHDVAESWKALEPVLQAEVDRLVTSIGLTPGDVKIENSGVAQAKAHEEMREKMLRDDVRRIYGPGAVATSTRVDASEVVPITGCRSAGCRTLGRCLCDCKKCRVACAGRT